MLMGGENTLDEVPKVAGKDQTIFIHTHNVFLVKILIFLCNIILICYNMEMSKKKQTKITITSDAPILPGTVSSAMAKCGKKNHSRPIGFAIQKE